MSNWEIHKDNFIYCLANKIFELRPCDIESINFGYFRVNFDNLDEVQKIYIDEIELKVNDFHLDEYDFKVNGDLSLSGVRVEQIYSSDGELRITLYDKLGNTWEIY
jgi:hypothetical protein